MTDARLDELERLEKVATTGPWEDNGASIDVAVTMQPVIEMVTYTHGYENVSELEWKEEDRRLITAARNSLPELIAEIRRLRTAYETQRARADALKIDNHRLHDRLGDTTLD